MEARMIESPVALRWQSIHALKHDAALVHLGFDGVVGCDVRANLPAGGLQAFGTSVSDGVAHPSAICPALFAAWWMSCFVVTYADGDQSRGADERGLGIILLPSMIALVMTFAAYYGSLALSKIKRKATQPS
jgi:hypothetical protein